MWTLISVLVIITLKDFSKGSPIGNSEEKCGYSNTCLGAKDGMINVHIVPHSHDDVGWKKTFDQYFWGSRSSIQLAGSQYILDSVVQELSLDSEKRFVYVETAFLWKWWNTRNERMRARLIKLINNGQLEIIGGAWSMHDEATTHYQSIIDQFTWGFRRLNDTFGQCAVPRIGWQIDPFGHSAETAAIMARLGFNALFVGRVDYREKSERLWKRELQVIWESSSSLGAEAELFTEILYNDYNAPNGFCFDVTCNDEPIIDDKHSPDYNLDRRVDSFVYYLDSLKSAYKGNSLILLMGGDFNFMAAQMYFTNLDKLINGVNSRNNSKFNLFYSTPSCYIKSLQKEGLEFSTKKGDFFPYGSNSNSYWTGYYTSRPTLKRFERISNNFLQVCKQLAALSNRGSEDRGRVDVLREAMGVLQHHDAISGTEQQHVAEDYARLLSEGLAACDEVTSDAINSLISKTSSSPRQSPESCLLLNISQCGVSEQHVQFVITLYNPLSHAVSRYARLPVRQGFVYSVRDHQGKEVPTQMVPIPQTVLKVPGRLSTATVEVVFRAENLPGLGLRSYYITARETEDTSSNVQAETVTGTFTIGDQESVKLIFDSTTGLPSQVFSADLTSPKKFSQDFYYYISAGGSNSTASGAYAFRPQDDKKTLIAEQPTFKYYKGPLVEEVHQLFSSWVSQVIRIYKGEQHVEFNWMVGPIPTNDTGLEIVTLYKMEGMNSSDIFYTDSNGREMVKRRTDRTLSQPVAGNYCPVTTRLTVKDVSDNTQLSVITDRAEGGTSLLDGELELMVHRRPLHDDGFWLFEGLDERAYGKGLVARGTHILTTGNSSYQSVKDRRLVQERVLDTWTFLTPTTLNFSEWQRFYNMEVTGLKSPLPQNVEILTLEPWKENSFLLRLEHILEKDDDQTAAHPVVVNLQDIFKPFSVTSVRETSLGANQWLEDVSRLVWKKGGNKETSGRFATQDLPEVSISPMDIKTFIIVVKFEKN